MEKRIQIKSLVNGTVVVIDPNIPIRREWTKKNQINTIPFDIMSDLIYQEGVKALFDDGVLMVVDKEARVELGLENPDGTGAVPILNENQMLGALVGKPEDLEKVLSTLPRMQIDELVQLAVEKEITDMRKVDIIKKYTGRDVLKLVQFKRQVAEDDNASVADRLA